MIQLFGPCNDAIKWFGLTEWDIRTTHTQADARSLVTIERGEVTLTVWGKDHEDGPRIVAIGNHHEGDTIIRLALPVPAAVPSHETPLETLADVCERYGLPLIAGDAESKFLYNAKVPGPRTRRGRSRWPDRLPARRRKRGLWR